MSSRTGDLNQDGLEEEAEGNKGQTKSLSLAKKKALEGSNAACWGGLSWRARTGYQLVLVAALCSRELRHGFPIALAQRRLTFCELKVNCR